MIHDSLAAAMEWLEAFGDEFEPLATMAEQKRLASTFRQFVGDAAGAGARDAYRLLLVERAAFADPEKDKVHDKDIER